MATLATDAQWGSSPKITFDFSYEKKREGSTQYYKVTVTCDPVTGDSYFGYPIYLEIKLAGTKVASKTLKDASPNRWTSALTYTTGWLSVPNKTTGTTALAIRVYSGMGTTRDKTYNYTLPIDPAASKISATDANIESASTITITKYDSKFTTTVAYKAAGQSSYTTIWTKQTHTSYGWTIPDSLYSLIKSAKEIEIELRCQTYSGNTLIGTETCTLTATTSESKCKPSVSITAVDTNTNTIALTGSNKKIIKGFSDVKVTTTATAENSADISSVSVTCGSEKKTGTSVTFSGAESATIKATAKDSRGYSNSASASGMTLVNYIVPTIVASVSRESPTSDKVNISVKGNWFNGSFGTKANTLKAQVRYKPKSQSAYADSDKYYDMTVKTSGNTYTATLSLTGLAYTSAYSIRIRVTDAIHVYEGPLADPVYRNTEISTGVPIFDWGESDFNFNVNVEMQKHLIFAHNTPSVKGITTDGSEVSALVPCNGKNNLVLGYGGYEKEVGASNIYGTILNLYCKNGLVVKHSDGDFNLLGALKALTTAYDCECTVTDGSGYSGCTATASLAGNNLRVSITVTRSSNTGAGNISNETVMTITLKHGGKIKGLYNTTFTSGASGTVASFQSDNEIVDANTRKISIKLCAVADAGKEWNAHFIMPCVLNLDAYT